MTMPEKRTAQAIPLIALILPNREVIALDLDRSFPVADYGRKSMFFRAQKLQALFVLDRERVNRFGLCFEARDCPSRESGRL